MATWRFILRWCNFSPHLSMKINDYFFLQYPSLEMFVNNSRFDQVTHQHLNLYSLKSISRVLNKNSFFITKYEFDNSVFGTIRLKIINPIKIRQI